MRILLAVDGSEHSEVATRGLIERPWPDGSVVRVVSVAQIPLVPVDAFAGVGMSSHNYELLSPALLEQAREVATRTVAQLQGAGLRAEAVVPRGDPRAEIVKAAAEWEAHLIMVGSHGRTGLQRWLLGSVAEYIVRHAPCSVEVVRRIPD